MKAIMVMFDSLNRHMLEPYGCQWTHTPNFARLAEKSVTFDRCYVGSMPCMPARRELHTGRYNFLHRAWGPLEPFDDSMPELLKKAGIYTHLVSDHYHYWEDGGCTYHNRYSTWECVRGQEGDNWKGHVQKPSRPKVVGLWSKQDEVNRTYVHGKEDFPQTHTFDLGLEFLRQNVRADGWFLQLETFDPHEPFVASQEHRALFQDGYEGPRFDWPPYSMVRETAEQSAHVRNEYAALLSQCDASLGRVLDFMDEHRMWDDTLLIVNTDHGFLLGEHECWAKCVHPFYNEIANTPLFIWDPRSRVCGQRRDALVQTIDLAPTLLDFFAVPIPKDMLGKPLGETVASNAAVRDTALFGIHGGQLCITDGRWVFMQAPVQDAALYNYTLMPCHMYDFFTQEELRQARLAAPFSFTKGCPVLATPCGSIESCGDENMHKNLLFDLAADPHQQAPLQNPLVEHQMRQALAKQLAENDAPGELYGRFSLPEQAR